MSRVRKGTVPPGFRTRAEAWKFQQDGTVVAYMRRIDYDGTQPCAGDDAFIHEGDYPKGELEIMAGMCAACPFLQACGDYALAHERYNYYAGETPRTRALRRRKLNIQVVDKYSSELYGLTSRGWPAVAEATRATA